MKKLKLLTSLSALVLVLSLGACSEPTDDTPSEQDEPTSSETTPEEPEPVVLSNYTLSITLKDTDGNPVVIPFYDTVYLCGDWDNWAAFIALTDAGDESGSVLTTTLDTISEGTHEFKGLIGNQDDTPSWSLTELIVNGTGNATFEVAASEGDNATKNLEFTVDATKIPVLEETPMDDETIMGLMLSAAEADYDEPWEAFHGYTTEEDETTVEVWFTTDEEEALYGKSIWYDDDEGNTTKFIVSGTAYVVDGDGEYDTQNYSNDYEDEFDNYGAALAEFAYASVEDLGENATLTNEEGSSYYTLTWADTYTEVLVCQRAGDEFSVSRVEEYDPNGDGAIAERISAAAVEAQMEEFNHLYWGANNPSELVEKVALTGNYSVEIQYLYFESENTITYAEYELAIAAMYGDTSAEALAALEKYLALEDDATLAQTITIDLYYDRDYIYVEEYVDNVLYMIDVTINADNGLWEYWTYDLSSWKYYSPSTFASVGASVWEDYYYSLFDAYDKGTADHLEYYEDYEAYDFDDWNDGYLSEASADWFCCLGGDHLFGLSNAWKYAYYYYTHYYTFFDEDDQELMSWYEYAYLDYVDYNDEDSDLYFGEEDIFMTVYDVGETDKRETVEHYHNGLQASINGSN